MTSKYTHEEAKVFACICFGDAGRVQFESYDSSKPWQEVDAKVYRLYDKSSPIWYGDIDVLDAIPRIEYLEKILEDKIMILSCVGVTAYPLGVFMLPQKGD